MEIEFKKQFRDKFEDIPNGEIFMEDDNEFIKICPIFTITSGSRSCINAIYLKNGSFYSFKNDTKVKWIKNAKLVINE